MLNHILGVWQCYGRRSGSRGVRNWSCKQLMPDWRHSTHMGRTWAPLPWQVPGHLCPGVPTRAKVPRCAPCEVPTLGTCQGKGAQVPSVTHCTEPYACRPGRLAGHTPLYTL